MTKEERREEILEKYKTAIKDVRYIILQYGNIKPEAWDTIKKIVFDPKLK